MKQLLTLMIFLASWFCANAQTNQPQPLTRKEPSEDNFSKRPQSPSDYQIYCLVEDGNVIVYSMEPLCGEVIATDALSGENLCEVTTDLGASYTFYIGCPRTVVLYVIVDGITYFCQIESD